VQQQQQHWSTTQDDKCHSMASNPHLSAAHTRVIW